MKPQRARRLFATLALVALLAPTQPAAAQPAALAGGPVTGVAQCGPTLLPGASVELLSGTSLFLQTNADTATAGYVFAGVPAGEYTLRISRGSDSCGRALTTDGGATSVLPPQPPVDLHNRSWMTAYVLTPPQNGLSVSVDEHLATRDQSAWFKFQVQPGSKVVATLSGLTANFDLTLYKDIAAKYELLTSGDDLVKLGAEFAPDAYSPDAYSPDAYSSEGYSPDAYSPDAYSPDAYSPDAYSPDAYSPDAYAADGYKADAYLEGKLAKGGLPGGEKVSPLAYTSAQTTRLVAVSALDGTATESVTRNTWNNQGDFYLRVRGRNGAFSLAAPFHLEVTLQSGDCGQVAPVEVASTVQPTAGGYRSIILFDPARVPATPDDLATLQTRLAAFAARPEVAGVVVNVGADARVKARNVVADASPACPYLKNLVAEAIKEIVDRYRTLNPTLAYVVVVGSDSAIPFFRYPDQAGLANEQGFSPPVKDDSASQASLKLGYVLGQDQYGAHGGGISRGVYSFPVFDLAVGRLVETASEITGMLDAYLATSSGVTPLTTAPLVTGYDFLADAALEVRAQLEAGTAKPAVALVQPGQQSPTDPDAWNADQLKATLLASRHDLVFLAGHFSPASALAADYKTRLLTSDVLASQLDMTNVIVFSAGCHSGYNTLHEDAVGVISPEMDWAQTAARKRFTLIGGTGYQYGDTDFVEYGERLYLELSKQLRTGTGPVSVGKALVAAKQAYLRDTPRLGGIHEKALLEATLFGLPQLSVDMPGARLTPLAEPSIVGGTSGYAGAPGRTLGLTRADVTVTPSLTQRTAASIGPAVMPPHTYLSGTGDRVATRPGEPVLPVEVRNVSVAGSVLRGVGFRGGPYTDTSGVRPLIGAPATELRGGRTPFLSDVLYPVQPWAVNYHDALAGGATRLSVTPSQYLSGQPGSETGTRRQFGPLSFRLFYSSNTSTYGGNTPARAAPPAISKVSAVPGVDGLGQPVVRFAVNAVGDPSAGMQEVWVTYTARSGPLFGKWQSLDLTQTTRPFTADNPSSLWKGTLPLGAGQAAGEVRYIVQAVNGVGLVTLGTNLGAYYTPGPETVTAPKQPTELKFQAPPAAGAYREAATFSARLTAGGVPLRGRPLTFALGAQRRRGLTDANGVATATLALFQPAGQYDVRVSFDETSGDLAAAASTPFQVAKQGTSLSTTPASATVNVGAPTPFVATLRDASPAQRVLRDRNVVFVVAGGGYSLSVAAVTDHLGRAALPSVPLPAGKYTVTAFFGGTVDLGDGKSVTLPGAGYEPSQASVWLRLV